MSIRNTYSFVWGTTMHSQYLLIICLLVIFAVWSSGVQVPVSAVAVQSVRSSHNNHRENVIYPRNNLEVGSCRNPDQRIYTDNTIVENGGPSTINGTLEIYIDAPIKITCIRIEDQVTDGTGAIPWIHSGGIDHAWVFIGVQAKYGKGFNFNIHLFGVPDSEKLKSLSLSSFRDNRVSVNSK